MLTEQGELLHRTTSDVINKLHTAETLLSDTTSKPSGELRITAPVGFGTVWLTQRLREFHDLYPEIRIELISTTTRSTSACAPPTSPSGRASPPHSDLIRRTLFTSRVRAFASTQYVRRFGAPKTLEELEGHSHRLLQRAAGPAPDRHQLDRDGGARRQGPARARVSRQQRRGHQAMPSAPASASA